LVFRLHVHWDPSTPLRMTLIEGTASRNASV